MSIHDEDTSRLIEEAKRIYLEYAQTQKDFQAPESHINIDRESDDTTRVHIHVLYKGIEYYFRSIEEKDLNDIYDYLNSQPLVRAKYADGNTLSIESTITRVKTLANRFRDKTSPLYLYSGFVVSDYQDDTFLGMVAIGGGTDMATAEISFLNRAECWSHPPTSTQIDSKNNFNNKIYAGIGTVEVCTLLQYAKKLKELNYKVNGHELQSVVAMSRIDNPGSWKAAAKAQMTLFNVDVVHRYGNYLRYQLKKDI